MPVIGRLVPRDALFLHVDCEFSQAGRVGGAEGAGEDDVVGRLMGVFAGEAEAADLSGVGGADFAQEGC